MTPSHLGPYKIVKRLGRGGMGTVYEGTDEATGQAVAVKMLASHLADDPGLRRRFFAEIETLKSLDHPAVVRLLAFGEEDGHPYFAMELVRGTSLEQRLRSGETFGWRTTVDVAASLARALKAAHDRGIVHRDLKPANVLLADDGATKLADFGIAKLFGGVALTAQGSVVGTAEYMAPEQASGQPTDHRVDLYALGAVIFTMLTGHPPFRGTSLAEIMEKQRRTPAPRVSTLVATVPGELDDLVDRLLSKDPAKRPATALVLLRLLESLGSAGGTPGAENDSDAVTIAMTDQGPPASADQTIAVTSPPSKTARSSVDLLAPTRDLTVGAKAATQRTGDPPKPGSASTTQVDSSRQTRFTTVEHLDRITREREQRAEARRATLRLVAAAAILASVAAGAYQLLRPLSADAMHERIMAVARGGGDLRAAEPLIRTFLDRHPTDPRAGAIQSLADTLSIDALERSLRRGRRDGAAADAIERDYHWAMDRAGRSPSAGLAAMETVRLIHGLGAPEGDASAPLKPLQALLQRQIERLEPLADAECRDDMPRIEATMAEAMRLGDAAARETDAEPRESLLERRRRLLEALIALYGDKPHAKQAVMQAARLLDALPTKEPAP